MDKNIVTYSRSMTVNLSRICANVCSYCDYPQNKLDQSGYELMVPYATIKLCAAARKHGVKEVRFISGDRPDNFAAVRARLDLWGFQSYIEYVYTVCELVFLEGLIPSIEIGYVTKDELAIIRRMTSAIVCMLDTVDDAILTKYAPQRTLNSRLEVIKYAGEGKLPVTTGILVGLGESAKSRKDAMEIIKHMHEKYGNIQNVVIQNYVPAKGNLNLKQGPSQKEMLDTVEMARKILPADIQLTVPAVYNPEIMPFIKLGVRDIGLFDITPDKILDIEDQAKLLVTIEKQLKREDLGLQRRLPIFSKYITENWYSRKLAQVLDKYKDLLKNAEGKSAHKAEEEAEDEFVVTETKPKKKLEPKTGAKPKKVVAKSKSKSKK